MRKLSFLLALVLVVCGCSSGSFSRKIRVGIDREWVPLNFGEQTAYVNGFTEDLLLEMAAYSGLEFELFNANWDSLQRGLKERKYDAILTSLPPYEYRRAQYEFSSNFLDIGPVLILPMQSTKITLNRLKGDLVGILANDPAVRILEKYPSIVIRQYDAIPSLFNALAIGEIDAAIIDQVPAAQYISDLYTGVLKIAGEPMNEEGLHMMGDLASVAAFEKSLKALKGKTAWKKLLKKWELSN